MASMTMSSADTAPPPPREAAISVLKLEHSAATGVRDPARVRKDACKRSCAPALEFRALRAALRNHGCDIVSGDWEAYRRLDLHGRRRRRGIRSRGRGRQRGGDVCDGGLECSSVERLRRDVGHRGWRRGQHDATCEDLGAGRWRWRGGRRAGQLAPFPAGAVLLLRANAFVNS